ncbi:MAG: HAD family hydrolase [Dehalococcoidia bacterium]
MSIQQTYQRRRKAVFLDKDGTLLENVPYNVEPSRMRLAERAGPALRLLQEAGYALFVVSNQSGIARGIFPESAIASMREHLEQLLKAEGVALAGFYYCPHHPDGTVRAYALPCTCRKPAPGLLHLAAREYGVDLQSSWLIGDILDDVEAGNRAACRTVLLDNGGETEWLMTPSRRPHCFAPNLYDAAWMLLANEQPLVQVGGTG